MDADGKLDKKEFSIAMFLIRKKLEGMQLPPTLPSGVKSDPQPAFLSSGRGPLSALSIDANTPNGKSFICVHIYFFTCLSHAPNGRGMSRSCHTRKWNRQV